MIKHVLFDVDGTLYDPSEGIINAILYALPRLQIPAPSDPNDLSTLIGPPLLESMQAYFSLSPARAKELLSVYREYYGVRGLFESYLYPGISKLLDDLHADGLRIHTATSKPIEYVEQLLDHFGVRDRFTFLAADDLACSRHSKTQVIRYGMENIPDMCPENTVMVGDRKFDVLSAHELGFRAIGCAWGHALAGELEAAGADFIAETPSDVRRIILSL